MENKKLTKFVVLVAYLQPAEGALVVPAEDRTDALLKAQALFDHRQGLKLVDVFPLSSVEGEGEGMIVDEVAPVQPDPEVADSNSKTAQIINFLEYKKKHETSDDQ